MRIPLPPLPCSVAHRALSLQHWQLLCPVLGSQPPSQRQVSAPHPQTGLCISSSPFLPCLTLFKPLQAMAKPCYKFQALLLHPHELKPSLPWETPSYVLFWPGTPPGSNPRVSEYPGRV